MKNKVLVLTLGISLILGALLFAAPQKAETKITSPDEFFGFTPGTDRELFDYEKLIEYMKLLEKQSPMVAIEQIGKSPMGKPMYIVFISSEENIKRLSALKEINRQLALNSSLDETTLENYLENGKVFFIATLSMHSGEVGPSQSAPIIAHQLVTTGDPEVQGWLDDVVYMMVPNHNPDGMDMVVNNYKKYKGTKYEGASLPGVYHKYVGHDNNRDFITLSQSDTKAISAIFAKEWFPQVMVEKHQMGSTGVRYFVPPPHDPIAQNIHANLWQWVRVFGSNMAKDMAAADLKGVAQQYLFDDYWPGNTETCIWKNVIGFLTEAASANTATPIYIEPNELGVYGKGLSEYKKGINFTFPWEGGWWRLGDIVQYEITSTMSIIKTSANHKKDILRFRNQICKDEVKRGKTSPPYYYIFPKEQHDTSEFVNMINLLMEHGVKVHKLTAPVTIGNTLYSEGDVVVALAQPFRPFIKEVLEYQKYPERHYTPGGEMVRPYDITTWSIPLHRGVISREIDVRSEDLEKVLEEIKTPMKLTAEIPETYAGLLFPAENNESYKAAFMCLKLNLPLERITEKTTVSGKTVKPGSFYLKYNPRFKTQIETITEQLSVAPIYLQNELGFELESVKMPRIGLVETWFHDMDSGWTRYVLDSYMVDYKVLRPSEIEKAGLDKNFDLLIFPSNQKSVLMEGKYMYRGEYYMSSYPPEYSKGMGAKGKEALLKFIAAGGKVVAWGSSTDLFMGDLSYEIKKGEKEHFRLPVRNIGKELTKKGLFCPGSAVRVELKTDHHLTYGLPSEISVFLRGSNILQTSLPGFDMDRRVIARFPEEDILLSGHVDNEELMANLPIMVWVKKGKGELILMGFNPQFRASTPVSYKLLFNTFFN